MQRVIEVATRALAKQAQGVSGFDFAVGLIAYEADGREVFDHLESMGTKGCMSMLLMVPALAHMLGDRVARLALEAWLDDFFQFDPSGQVEAEGKTEHGLQEQPKAATPQQ